jgi:muconate cycloisomerase
MSQARLLRFSLWQLAPAVRRAPRRIVIAARADTGEIGWSAGLDARDRWAALERLCRCVLGQAPSETTRRHQALGLAGPPLSQTGDLAAAGLVDNAVLDLAARLAGVPLALWLGGHAHTRVPLADRVNWADAPGDPSNHDRVRWLVDRAGERIERHGFASLTVRPGNAELAALGALLQALRARFGARVGLRVDCAGFPASDRRAIASTARELGVECLIDPGRSAAALGRLGPVPLAVSPSPVLHEIAIGGRAQIVRLEPAAHGGAAMAQRFASIARVFQLELLLAGSTGLAIELALLAQLARATPAALQPLDFGPDPTTVPGIEVRDGVLHVPDGPGLGIAIDAARLTREALRTVEVAASLAAAS